MIYLDTSAFLKLFIQEPGSDQVRQMVDQTSFVLTHLLTYAETRAGLAKAARMHRINFDELSIKKQELEHDWRRMDILTPNEIMIRRAGDLTEQFGLRGYDSVHLAAAEMLNRESPMQLTFACFDRKLNHAAQALEMTIIESA